MKTNLKIYTLLVFIGMICKSLSAQEIINVTTIPDAIAGTGEVKDIKIIDGKIIAPIFDCTNETYQYLPEMDVDSFESPLALFSTLNNFRVKSTLFSEYEPNIGFVDKTIINLTQNPEICMDNSFVAFTGSTYYLGINNKMIFDYPESADSANILSSLISVFDKSLDSFIYLNVFSEIRNFNLKSDIEGDYIYVNIPLTDEDKDDLIFMGDTLTYPEVSYGNDCNYLVKINFKTGQKEWIRHIGYGDVRQLMIDDDNRINIEMVGASPLVYEFERVNEDELLIYNSWYDEVIFRINLDGEYIEKTRIYTFADSDAVREMEFNSDGSFQAFGMVTAPKYIRVDEDSLDFLDATSFYEGKGLILVFDEHLDYKWGREITSDSITLVTAVNRSPNGDYVVSSLCECSEIYIDGQTYYEEPPWLNWLIQRATLFRFDSNGALRGTPLVGDPYGVILDIQAFTDDHYLILYKFLGPFSFEFIGEEFGDLDNENYFIEYKGDLFDLATTLEEYFDATKIKVSPNPAESGEYLSIEIPENRIVGTELTVYNSQGQRIDSQYLTSKLYRVPSNLPSGIYYLRLANNNESKSITIYIK
ncbi:MAG: hypothetical protein ACJATI_003859 [Halioglobus sp.]|jgi:hypothetical protein